MLACAGALTVVSCGNATQGANDGLVAKEYVDSVHAANLKAAKAEAGEASSAADSDSLTGSFLTTPDLALHDVHGDVKALTEPGRIIHFTQEGQWVDTPAVVKRGPDGKILKTSKVLNNPEYEITYLWNGDRVVKVSSSSRCIDRSYGKSGLADSAVEVNPRTGGVKIVYSDYKFDHKGNWIERAALRTYYQGGKSMTKERRQIKYYSDSEKKGGAADAVDTLTFAEYQKYKDEVLKQGGGAQAAQTAQPAMEDTKWLDGIWKLNVKEQTSKGLVPLNFTVVIDAKSGKLTYSQGKKKLYSGPYKLIANYIRFGGYALPLDAFTSVVKFSQTHSFQPSTR